MSDPYAWKADEVEKLRHYWNVEGFSASEIAYRLPGHSRNSVIGKVHRLGLARRRIGGEASAKPPKPKRHRSAALHRHVHDRIIRRMVEPVMPPDTRRRTGDAWKALPGTLPVSLVDLEAGMCKWPIGDDRPYLFCGVATGEVYCEHHATIARGVGTPSERAAA